MQKVKLIRFFQIVFIIGCLPFLLGQSDYKENKTMSQFLFDNELRKKNQFEAFRGLIETKLEVVLDSIIMQEDEKKRSKTDKKKFDKDLKSFLNAMTYVATLPFANSLDPSQMNDEFLNEIVLMGLRMEYGVKIPLGINEHGHDIENKKEQSEWLNKIINSPKIDDDKRITQIIKKMMVPNKVDAVLTGEFKISGDFLSVRPILIIKKYRKIFSRRISFEICKNKNERIELCRGEPKDIFHELKQLILNLPEKDYTWKDWFHVDRTDRKLMEALSKLIDQRVPDVPGQQFVYITNLSFMDAGSKSIMIKKNESDLLNNAVIQGIKQVIQLKPYYKFNEPGHEINNTDNNVSKIADIIYDPNKTPEERMLEITNNIMNVNNVDVILSGQFLDEGSKVIIKPIAMVKQNKKIVAKTLKFEKSDYLCPDPANPHKKSLCTGAHEEIIKAVKELLSQL